LRLSRAYLRSDPPRHREWSALTDHVRGVLAAGGVPRLERGETLVGTGGTIRNLAKVDRERRTYPIRRIHGYTLRRASVDKITRRLVTATLADRGRVPGLSDERADSIAGGAAGIAALLKALWAGEVVVSGMGVREGLAYATCSEGLPEPEADAESSVHSLCSRFRDFDAGSAKRRAELARALQDRVDSGAGSEIAAALGRAATVLDIGSSVDFFDRHDHAADIVLGAELHGLTHREIALVSAIVRASGDRGAKGDLYEPLLTKDDWDRVLRAGALLALADDIERRCEPGLPMRHSVRAAGRRVVFRAKGLLAWRPHASTRRFEGLFGRTLVVEPGGAPR
jgi:exopolyphosphatase/guanosine-5'-triphosphate,3'-diphosphate pyrophosphatase